MRFSRQFSMCVLSLVLLGVSGCGGGTPVEEQERFQSAMNQDPDAAASVPWRSAVSGLKSAMLGGEAGSMQQEMEYMMEDTGSLNVMKLPEAHQATGSAIMDKMEELKAASSKAEQKELIEEMEELVETLPK